jgi:hypothetical protein
MATFKISLELPEVVSATKRIEKNQANIPLRIVQEVTVKGKLLALNNTSGYAAIWAIINGINDSSEAKNCSLSFPGVGSFSSARILSINFDNSANQDRVTKDFSISFETYTAFTGSHALTSYGVLLEDLKELSDIKISQSKETNLEGDTLTTSVGLTFAENANTFTLSRAESISKAIISAANVLTISSTRITNSNIYDEKSGTYNFIQTKNTFRESTGGFGILRSTNYNIQQNGAIVVSENTQIKIEKIDDYKISEIYDKATSEATSALGRATTFLAAYYKFSYGTLPAGYKTSFSETTRQITVDESTGSAQCNVSFTNEPEFMWNVRVEITNIIENIVKEDSKRKITRGSITGIKSPPNLVVNPNANAKIKNAKDYFDKTYKKEFEDAVDFIDKKSSVLAAKYKTYITNGDISYNISEGSINFSLTYESKPIFNVTDSTLIYGSVQNTTQSAVHLANQMIVIGGFAPGEELIQESAQSRPVENNIKFDLLFKKATDIKTYITKIKDFIKTNYKDGILTSLSISANLIQASMQASASWMTFGEHRERSNTASTVVAPTEIKL